jgi:hypothetical protein
MESSSKSCVTSDHWLFNLVRIEERLSNACFHGSVSAARTKRKWRASTSSSSAGFPTPCTSAAQCSKKKGEVCGSDRWGCQASAASMWLSLPHLRRHSSFLTYVHSYPKATWTRGKNGSHTPTQLKGVAPALFVPGSMIASNNTIIQLYSRRHFGRGGKKLRQRSATKESGKWQRDRDLLKQPSLLENGMQATTSLCVDCRFCRKRQAKRMSSQQ